ncbi:MAG: DM13 domain-containing protein, partial [Rhodospirillaceae bacterium]|nr:DM13 domain-containing protein [Rhodospirillaceae bacterium]
ADSGARSVELLGMQIVPGPNLFVYLVENEDPLFPEDVEVKFLSLGKLKSLTGDQSYAIPVDVDLAAWGSVVVWCDTFKTAFAVGTIAHI